MIRWLRYGNPRRFVLRFTGCFPVGSWPREKLLAWLYPPDATITFK
jgi:hypothetical protein